jgi:hypothetical protein
MALKPEKFHSGTKENVISNHPLSSSTRSSSGRKTSAEQRKSTSRSSAGRAKSTRPFRESIRSAVPDSAIISIAKRPDQGGTGNSQKKKISSILIFLFQVGRTLKLFTNHFICNIPRTLKCHQYDIELEVPNRDNTWRPARKDDRFVVLRKIIERENFPLVWYDEGKNLYSIELLTGLKDQYEINIRDVKSDREQKYRLLIINLVKSYDIQVKFRLIS